MLRMRGKMKIVLFVCVHNSGRSQMAEAFFNQIANGKAQAFSAGTQPAEHINPMVVKSMREVSIDIGHNKPKALTTDMVEQANRVITMGCSTEAVCPATFIETEDWALEDPEGKTLEQVRKIRDDIKNRVSKLLKEMKLT